jgi:hypothetical protein
MDELVECGSITIIESEREVAIIVASMSKVLIV